MCCRCHRHLLNIMHANQRHTRLCESCCRTHRQTEQNFAKGRAAISLDSVKKMIISVLCCVGTCIAYATDTFGHYVYSPRAYKVPRSLVSTQVVAKIKSRCFWNFQDTQTDSPKIVKGRAGISVDSLKNMFTTALGCVSTCIAFDIDTFLTYVYNPRAYKVTRILVSAQVVAKIKTRCLWNCKGPSWNMCRQCENMFMAVLGCVSTCIAFDMDTFLTLCL